MMTWEVTAVDGGTRVDIVAQDVPDGISAQDHAAGFAASLANLAALVETRSLLYGIDHVPRLGTQNCRYSQPCRDAVADPTAPEAAVR